MKTEAISAFLEACDSYFATMTQNEIKLGIPKITDDGGSTQPYTGAVEVRGSMTGSIYFSASEQMLKSLGEEILGGPIEDPELLESVVGEIANTISGNAQKAFGKDFTIDVPRVVVGDFDPKSGPLSKKQISVKLNWRGFEGYLVLGIE